MITVQTTDLAPVLALARSIAHEKAAMPILSRVLFRTKGTDKLLVSATDLSRSMTAEIAGTNTIKEAFTVDAQAVADIVNAIPTGEITLHCENLEWVDIQCETDSERLSFRLPVMLARDFPKLPEREPLGTLEASVLRDMLDRTMFAVGHGDRKQLRGVRFESDGETARMVATDGYRMAMASRPMPGWWPHLHNGITIAWKGAQDLRALCNLAERLRMTADEKYLYVRGGGITLSVPLIRDRFPPYWTAIPESTTTVVDIDRALLLGALRRITKSHTALLLVSDDRLSLTGDLGTGEFEADVVATCTGTGTIGLDPRFLREPLETMLDAERVTIGINGPQDACVIRPVGTEHEDLSVVMPKRT